MKKGATLISPPILPIPDLSAAFFRELRMSVSNALRRPYRGLRSLLLLPRSSPPPPPNSDHNASNCAGCTLLGYVTEKPDRCFRHIRLRPNSGHCSIQWLCSEPSWD